MCYLIVTMSELKPSHYDDAGRARMVDISGKPQTTRTARAAGEIRVGPAVLAALDQGTVPKGNPFEAARLAGIAAAKKTADLIQLCHPLRLNVVDIDIVRAPDEPVIRVTASVSADERTGVEMEALTACSVALLVIYDMLKAVDKGMVIGPIRLIEKSGGKSDYTVPPAP